MAKLPYNVTRDLIPVIQTSSQAYLVLVRQSSPIKSIRDLLSYAQQQPKKISYGTPGHGSSGHLSIEQFCLEAAVQMTHVAYKGDNLGSLPSPTLGAIARNRHHSAATFKPLS